MTTTLPPICIRCTRLSAEGLSCDAFPKGIPETILEYRHDHRKPLDGDNGLTFDPITPEDAAWAESMIELAK